MSTEKVAKKEDQDGEEKSKFYDDEDQPLILYLSLIKLESVNTLALSRSNTNADILSKYFS